MHRDTSLLPCNVSGHVFLQNVTCFPSTWRQGHLQSGIHLVFSLKTVSCRRPLRKMVFRIRKCLFQSEVPTCWAVSFPGLCGWRRGVVVSGELFTDVSCNPTAVCVVPSALTSHSSLSVWNQVYMESLSDEQNHSYLDVCSSEHTVPPR